MKLENLLLPLGILAVAAIAETIITAGWVKSGKEEDYKRAIRLDRTFLSAMLTVLIIGFLLLIGF